MSLGSGSADDWGSGVVGAGDVGLTALWDLISDVNCGKGCCCGGVVAVASILCLLEETLVVEGTYDARCLRIGWWEKKWYFLQ